MCFRRMTSRRHPPPTTILPIPTTRLAFAYCVSSVTVTGRLPYVAVFMSSTHNYKFLITRFQKTSSYLLWFQRAMRESGLALPAQDATKYHITIFVISIAKRFMANGKRKSEMGRLSFSLIKQGMRMRLPMGYL